MQKNLSPFIIWQHENTKLVLFIFQLFPILYYFQLSLLVSKGGTKKLNLKPNTPGLRRTWKMLYIYELASVPGVTKRGVAKKKKKWHSRLCKWTNNE